VNSSDEKKTVIVLGIARSGTSMAAGMLHLMGVDMCPERNPSTQNPGGSFENREFIALTTKIRADGRPDGELKETYTDEIKRLLEKHGAGQKLFGWKSALTHFSLDLFLPHIRHPYLVFVFRDPLENALSLLTHKKVVYSLESSLGRELVEIGEQVAVLGRLMGNHLEVPQINVSYEGIRRDPVGEARRLAAFLDLDLREEQERQIYDFIIPDYRSWGKELVIFEKALKRSTAESA